MNANCQNEEFDGYDPEINSYNKIGIASKLIDKIPVEISFVHLNDTAISFLLNAGYCQFNFDVPFKFTGDLNYPYQISNMNYSAKSAYLKGGIILFHTKGYVKSANVYNSLNVIGSATDYVLQIAYHDDIYGNIIQNYKERKYNLALEIETGILVNLGKSKRFVIHSGFSIGAKLINQKPFDNAIKNLDQITTYTPGIGYGNVLYLNISIGLGFRVF